MQYPGDYVTIVKKPSNRYDRGLFEIRGIPNTFFEFSYLGDRGFIEIKESGTAMHCVNRNVKEGKPVSYNFSKKNIAYLREQIRYLLDRRLY